MKPLHYIPVAFAVWHFTMLPFAVAQPHKPETNADKGIVKPQIRYPTEAFKKRMEGKGVLLVHVAPDGSVKRVDMKKSTGHRVLDEAARSAFLTARFRKGTPSPVTIPISFSLSRSRR